MTITQNNESTRIERSVPDIGYIDENVFVDLGFVQTVTAGNTIYVSGIAPLTVGSTGLDIVGASFAEQLEYTLEMLDRTLQAAGANRCDLVAWTVYTTDMAALAASAPTFKQWVGHHPPTSTWVGAASLIHPEQLVELTAIAVH